MKKLLSLLLVISSFSLFSCNNVKEEQTKVILKASIFSDVQLTTNNQDSTSNAYISLLDQLRFSKDNEVDVLFIGGDLVNNAIESYYQLFEKALKKVYGNDETLYPEFVYTIGNHEWWDINEKNDENAVTLFKKYARIESDNLVATSSYKYPLNQKVTVPSYYKVIKGIPFISYSAEGSAGKTTNSTLEEMKNWLDEASNLDSVKKGGPILIGFHYPLDQITYETPNYNNRPFTKLLKDYPQAIVFTGDSHYPSINERAITQKDFTTINIGSSSYSRMVSSSALKESYYNVGSSSKDIVLGDENFKSPYVENIQLLSIDNKGNTTIERFINNKDKEKVKKVGITWKIDAFKSKDNFIYTNSRYKNMSWANIMYNQDGLSFDNENNVEFDIKDNKMIVKFKDVNNYNYCDHYKIILTTDNNQKEYNFVSNYYIYFDTKQTHCYTIDNVESSNNYKVEVIAYDFFDNPSINKLESSSISINNLFYDDYEANIVKSYTNSSKRLNYEDTNNSNASIEYYFAGNKIYDSGMVLASFTNLNEYLFEDYTFSVDIKNNNNYSLELFLEINGISKKNTYSKIIEASSNYESISWNLNEIVGNNAINQIVLKVYVDEKYSDFENGYDMSLLLDNINLK